MSDQNLIGAATNLAVLLEAPERRSLRHRSHMRLLRKGHRAVEKILAGYFTRQKAAVLQHVRPLLGNLREDRADSKRRAAILVPDTLSPLSFPITAGEGENFNIAISDAIVNAARQLAAELGTDAALRSTVAGDYLRLHSLSQLTGQLSATTKERLRNAIADVFDRGGTGEDIIAAIKAEFAGFSDKRAGLIAQTEVNAAYNSGRVALANNAGMREKSWITESDNPCPQCTANEDQGWIPIGDLFQSGDAQPVAHPMCYCSVDFRSVT